MSEKVITYYKIRSRQNPELYRKADGTWNKSGKVYDTIGKLRSMLTHAINNQYEGGRNRIGDWEIVEYVVRESQVKSVNDMIRPEQLVKLLQK